MACAFFACTANTYVMGRRHPKVRVQGNYFHLLVTTGAADQVAGRSVVDYKYARHLRRHGGNLSEQREIGLIGNDDGNDVDAHQLALNERARKRAMVLWQICATCGAPGTSSR